MKNSTRKLISIVVFLSVFFGSSIQVFAAFGDIQPNSTYKQDVEYIQGLGVLDPSLTNFHPTDPITRQEYAKWLLKSMGYGNENYKPKKSKPIFVDVPISSNPYAPYIYRLRDTGAINMSAKGGFLFHPTDPITRKDALTWLFFVDGIPTPKIFNESGYSTKDVSVNSPLAAMVAKSIELGILPANSAVNLTKKLKRQDAAHFLYAASDASPIVHITVLPSIDSSITRNSKFDILSTTFDRVKQTYLRRNNISEDDLIYGAAQGLVKGLGDKHSDFEPPGKENVIESLSGQVEGIGAMIQEHDDQIEVVSPLVGSPAEKAGLLPNDIILTINGVSTEGMGVQEAASRIKGEKGTQVKLEIKRGKEVITLEITRDIVKIISASIKFTKDNIAQITLSDFGSETASEFRAISKTIVEKNPKGIVLDIRNNPGGYLTTAISIAGHFIKDGQNVAIVKYPDHEEVESSNGEGELAPFKTIVLVNAGSASASEILAGSLQDFGLATVVGTITYGKGTVQEVSSFTDGSTLRLTVAEWLTPKRRSIEKVGITPDEIVKLTDEDRKAGRDPQMDRALSILR